MVARPPTAAAGLAVAIARGSSCAGERPPPGVGDHHPDNLDLPSAGDHGQRWGTGPADRPPTRKPPSGEAEGAVDASGHRHGHRSRLLLGSFDEVEIEVPRVRV